MITPVCTKSWLHASYTIARYLSMTFELNKGFLWPVTTLELCKTWVGCRKVGGYEAIFLFSKSYYIYFYFDCAKYINYAFLSIMEFSLFIFGTLQNMFLTFGWKKCIIFVFISYKHLIRFYCFRIFILSPSSTMILLHFLKITWIFSKEVLVVLISA